jgi:hypothetical protein
MRCENVRFEVVTVVIIKFTTFWNVNPCVLVVHSQYLQKPAACIFRKKVTLKMEAAGSSKTSDLPDYMVSHPIRCKDGFKQ